MRPTFEWHLTVTAIVWDKRVVDQRGGIFGDVWNLPSLIFFDGNRRGVRIYQSLGGIGGVSRNIIRLAT